MNTDVKVIYNKIKDIPISNSGYIDLNDSNVSNTEDLVKICSLFRDPRYETFRIIYVRDNKIIGNEYVTNRVPNSVVINNTGKHGYAKYYEQLKSRIKRLNATGYYMIHNHSSEFATPSREDIVLTKKIASNVDGFLGHIILGCTDKYSFLEQNEYGMIVCNQLNQSVDDKTRQVIDELYHSKSLYDIKISSRTELVALLQLLRNENEFSDVVLTNGKGQVRMIFKVPNSFFNQEPYRLNGYFKNIARTCGANRVFVGTQSRDVYEKIEKHFYYGTIKDYILFDSLNENYLSYESKDILQKSDLFGMWSPPKLMEESNNYDKEDKKMNDKFKILYKKVNEPAVEMEVENTLEAKQALVGGLIEIVPLDDVLLVCNEEGKLLNLKPNLMFDYDFIAGDCFVIGDDYENGDFKSLTKDEIKKYKKELDKRAFKYIEIDAESKNEKEI